jgi:uncharacterized protein (TIGR02266 family)
MSKGRRALGFAFRSGRAPAEIPIDFQRYGESFVATSINIGLGGLFVTTDRRFEVGERVNLRFSFRDQALSIAAEAEVRWIHQDQGEAVGVGLRFVRLPAAAVAAIREFLRSIDDDLTAPGTSI